MKAFTRIIAVVMLIAMLGTMMAACNKYTDDRIVGTWSQTDEIDGNWTWTFEKDGKCKLVGETTGFESEGTYRFEGEGIGKIYINLKDWTEEKTFTYTVTEKVLDLEETYSSFHCLKQ